MSRISTAWQRIEVALRQRMAPEVPALPPGAAPEAVSRVEAEIGLQLPEPVRESYLRHDGSNRLWICAQGFLMPLVAPEHGPLAGYGVLDLWRAMGQVGAALAEERAAPEGAICATWWNDRWVPLTENECGDFVCLDFAPGPGGAVGQVIEWCHERGPTRVLAPSFEEWLVGLFG